MFVLCFDEFLSREWEGFEFDFVASVWVDEGFVVDEVCEGFVRVSDSDSVFYEFCLYRF